MTRMFGKNSDYTSDPDNPEVDPAPAEAYMMLGAADDDPVPTWDDPPTIAQIQSFFDTGDMTNGRPAIILRSSNAGGRKELDVIADLRIRGNTTIIGTINANGTNADEWEIDQNNSVVNGNVELGFGLNGAVGGWPAIWSTRVGGADDGNIYFNRDLSLGGNNVINVGTVDGVDISVHAGNVAAHHARYTDAEAIAAVVAENPLSLTNSLEIGGDTILDSLSNVQITFVAGTSIALAYTTILSTCVNAGVDTDKFLVLDAGNRVDFRTGAEVLTDIGGATSGHLHDTQTLQHDGVNSNGGAFSFTTSGAVTFSQRINAASLELGGVGSLVDIVRDEDNMVSDDDAALATQQSIKAYVDGHTHYASPVKVTLLNEWYHSTRYGATWAIDDAEAADSLAFDFYIEVAGTYRLNVVHTSFGVTKAYRFSVNYGIFSCGEQPAWVGGVNWTLTQPGASDRFTCDEWSTDLVVVAGDMLNMSLTKNLDQSAGGASTFHLFEVRLELQ